MMSYWGVIYRYGDMGELNSRVLKVKAKDVYDELLRCGL